MEEIVKQVQGNLKVAQDRQKSQADLKRTPKEFQVGEHVFIKVRPKKSSMRLGMSHAPILKNNIILFDFILRHYIKFYVKVVTDDSTESRMWNVISNILILNK